MNKASSSRSNGIRPLSNSSPDLVGIDSRDRYTLGVCAMNKKSRSKPMLEILKRVEVTGEFNVIIFGDEMILNTDISEWPIVDSLIAFYSSGFPLNKCREYVELRKPILVNNLDKQTLLQDRREVYRTLSQNGIPVPKHVFVNRLDKTSLSTTTTQQDSIDASTKEENDDTLEHDLVADIEDASSSSLPSPSAEVVSLANTNSSIDLVEEHNIVEADDYIIVNGNKIDKPFVEKPVDGDDHNIHIYYPMSAGGGCKRLFRKVGNRSSEFHPDVNKIRREGSYIYEEFMSTQGTDVKVYTVGPNYAHAEARKSPVLDGKVLRDDEGKEIRYPVILTTEEKEIARKVCRAFEQTICGFDILRVAGQSTDESIVCDVNGFSFVKNSKKYFDDCSILLRKSLLKALKHQGKHFLPSKTRSLSLDFSSGDESDNDSMLEESGFQHHHNDNCHHEELRCVIGIVRHGDRTPKQKMKMTVTHPFFINYYEKRSPSDSLKELKLKAVSDLQELLTVAKRMIVLYENKDEEFLDFFKSHSNLKKHMKGIHTIRDVLERWQLCGINRKFQLKPRQWDTDSSGKIRVNTLLLILKWGGDLTATGMNQAENLGRRFRHTMYPGGTDGSGGLLRLHSTYRHDLKIYAGDEGRVQKTAASFAKGFLELEGDIIPILVSLVLKGSNLMLDQSGTTAQHTILQVKKRLHDLLHRGDDFASLKIQSDSNILRSVTTALGVVDQPMKRMEAVHLLLSNLKEQLEGLVQAENNPNFVLGDGFVPHGRETLEVVAERWAKLYRDFYDPKNNTYDLSKIPDIFDCIRYDAMHNSELNLSGVSELLSNARILAHAIVPQEYGMTLCEKLEIGSKMCHSLLKKIKDDLAIARGLLTHRLHPQHAKDMYVKSAHRSVRTRLYFTSESHIYTLLNLLRYPVCSEVDSPISKEASEWIETIPELGYMTHIVIRIFERPQFKMEDPLRFRTEIQLSPGATGCPLDVDNSKRSTNSPKMEDQLENPEMMDIEMPKEVSELNLTCDHFQRYISKCIEYNTVKRCGSFIPNE